jgi:hypothetical protein
MVFKQYVMNMSQVESDFKKLFAGPENGRGDWGDGGRNKAQDSYLCAEQLYQDIVKARTNNGFQAAIDNAAPVNYVSNQQLAPAGAPSTLEQVVIQPGESGGLLTYSGLELAKFCTEERLRKKTSDSLA